MVELELDLGVDFEFTPQPGVPSVSIGQRGTEAAQTRCSCPCPRGSPTPEDGW